MFWSIDSFPETVSHVFLSHTREDFESLVVPVYRKLKSRRIRPWLDRHDWSYGRDSRTTLRDAILRSRHTVFFITDSFLRSPRGWCVLELAYSEILQSNLVRSGGLLSNIALPLFFTKRNSIRIARSVWQQAKDRGHFFVGDDPRKRIHWTVGQIESFLQREQRLAMEIAQRASDSESFRQEIDTVPGRLLRVTRFQPLRTSP
jgi:hypothetical protein